ncbi:MAG: DUF4129 domain-containing protein [Anaeromyxobacter sp.]
MTGKARRGALLALALALAATAVAGLALPRLSLGPGLPLPALGGGRLSLPAGPGEPQAAALSTPTWAVALLGLLALAVVALAGWRALRSLDPRSVARGLVRGALVVAATGVALALLLQRLPRGPAPPSPAPLPTPPPLVHAPPGEAPSLLRWLVAAGLAALALALAARLLRPRPPDARQALLAQLAGEADQAGRALRTGGGGDVIIACWAAMAAAVAAAWRVERPEATTAHEFAAQLAALGLPRAPVEELTALFEEARYGAARLAPPQQARALSCLAKVVEACRAASARPGAEVAP